MKQPPVPEHFTVTELQTDYRTQRMLKREPIPTPTYMWDGYYPCCMDCDYMCAGNHRVPCRCQA